MVRPAPTTSRCAARTSRTPSRTSTRAPAAAASRSSRSSSPTAAGDIWKDVTREIAQRGQSQQLPGTPPDAAPSTSRSCSTTSSSRSPFIDFVQNPNGIDGANGSQIEGGFTIELRAGAREPAEDRRAAGQARAHLAVAGLGDARPAVARPGPRRGRRGLRSSSRSSCWSSTACSASSPSPRCSSTRLYFFALIKLIPITLTLPGIAGLILTIGVAADANIVIFERVKEEIRARQIGDRGPRRRLPQGPRRRSSTRTS